MEQILEQEQEAHFDKEGSGRRQVVFHIMDQKPGKGLQAQTAPPGQVIGAEVVGKHRKLKGNNRGNDVSGEIGRPNVERIAENKVGEQPKNTGIDNGTQDIGQEEFGESLQQVLDSDGIHTGRLRKGISACRRGRLHPLEQGPHPHISCRR